uniref:AD domain-containing protein n=2 Tax=Octopus bimaculoides TaxID=37653 RepID=A0A0L8HKU4_OCTBM
MVEESCHPIFTQDPAHWMQYIYKKVRVHTGPNQEHVGHVYTVDPVTSSFILVRFPPTAVSDTATSTVANETGTSSSSATTPNTTTASDTTAATEVKASDISANTTSPASTPKTSVEVCVIPGHAVVDVVVLQEDENNGGDSRSGDGPKDSDHEEIKARLDALFLNSKNSHLGFGDSGNIGIETNHLSEEALSEHKDKLKSWLLKNRLPVQEQKGQDDGKEKCLCVAGAVTILPPYGPGNCCSTNEIILSRIQNLIRNMPPTV